MHISAMPGPRSEIAGARNRPILAKVGGFKRENVRERQERKNTKGEISKSAHQARPTCVFRIPFIPCFGIATILTRTVHDAIFLQELLKSRKGNINITVLEGVR
ncbi:hypothetical protein BDBG_16181 [Blastomyces gilchristii SLH14081]|uniref:Uncharacterized protein n=1 Tax=Blastomyces gilchristii (strain SLH14081) TaxID=559298 RepID=A0A179U9Y0_BLAGS|nr:uncharacterized protein BDBG_16181 [Blastomyces gilchristii SLH14081]OAT04099.1 hypothetical protein BDBG_16181 [Blastomyces gilchristii SLH14081]